MLTQLNNLRRQHAAVFIVATNRLRSFDSAVTRPGRFDMLCFVGTPNLPARVAAFRRKLSASSALGEVDVQKACAELHAFLASHWEVSESSDDGDNKDGCSGLRFLSFAENDALSGTAVALATTGSLSRDSPVLVARAAALLATSTIQGGVRDEYLASEPLSRV
jgi:SpoVK/Ycf46/Vps4 family AAA+-type ATPase